MLSLALVRLFALFVLAVLAAADGVSLRAETAPLVQQDDAASPILTPAEMKEDLEFMMTLINEVHPDLYYRVSSTEVAARREQLVAGLGRPLHVREFQERVHAFVNGFADRHTQVWGPARPPLDGSPHPPSEPTWSFQMLSGKIAYLNFFGMDTSLREAWQKFLAKTFQTIQAESAVGLIVDLRQNGGGDSNLGDDLLQYITDRPYRQTTRKEWKFSPRYMESTAFKQFWAGQNSDEAKAASTVPPRPEQRALFAQNPSIPFKELILAQSPDWAKEYLHKYAPHWLELDYSPQTASEFFVWDFSKLTVPPSPLPLRFHGPVCFLIGANTFSSAIMLGNAVQDFHLATLVGEETSPCNEFGEIFPFTLPHSKLEGMVPSARLVRANGDAKDQHGILPDIPTTQTAEEKTKNIDPALAAAVAWIAAHRG